MLLDIISAENQEDIMCAICLNVYLAAYCEHAVEGYLCGTNA